VNYTDITPSTREGASNPALIARDGLHPSGMEYRKWAELLAPKIKDVLQ
jgi:lysophospholipase L1-like esterase